MDLASGSDNPYAQYSSENRPFISALKRGETALLATQSKMKFLEEGVGWWAYQNQLSDDLRVSALPRGERPTMLGVAWTILGIPTTAAQPDQSLASLRTLWEAFEPGSFLPARKTGPDLRAISSLTTDRDAKVLSASLDIVRFLPGDVGAPILELVAKELVLPVVSGKKKPQTAANDAQKAIDAAMAR